MRGHEGVWRVAVCLAECMAMDESHSLWGGESVCLPHPTTPAHDPPYSEERAVAGRWTPAPKPYQGASEDAIAVRERALDVVVVAGAAARLARRGGQGHARDGARAGGGAAPSATSLGGGSTSLRGGSTSLGGGSTSLGGGSTSLGGCSTSLGGCSTSLGGCSGFLGGCSGLLGGAAGLGGAGGLGDCSSIAINTASVSSG